MMKRFLMILVLGLLLSSNAYAKDQKIYHKDENSISLAKAERKIASKHCAQYKKFAFLFKGGGDDGVKNEKGKGTVLYHCSSRGLRKDPFTGRNVSWTNYDENHEFADKEKEDKKFEKIEGYKATCNTLGFELGTDKFADCTLKLYVADNKETTQIVQSSSGVQEMIIYDPDREHRINMKKWNDNLTGKCRFSDPKCW